MRIPYHIKPQSLHELGCHHYNLSSWEPIHGYYDSGCGYCYRWLGEVIWILWVKHGVERGGAQGTRIFELLGF